MSNKNTQAKLKWQCRRGTQELDRMLLDYLNHHYANAKFTEQQHFQQLLDLEDDLLIHYLLGDKLPETTDLAHLVKQIRSPLITTT